MEPLEKEVDVSTVKECQPSEKSSSEKLQSEDKLQHDFKPVEPLLNRPERKPLPEESIEVIYPPEENSKNSLVGHNFLFFTIFRPARGELL